MLSELPRLTSGKLDKVTLRARLADNAGGADRTGGAEDGGTDDGDGGDNE